MFLINYNNQRRYKNGHQVISLIVSEFKKMVEPFESYFPEKVDIFVRGNWTCLAIENDELCFENRGNTVIVSKQGTTVFFEVAKITFSKKTIVIAYNESGKTHRLSTKQIRELIQVTFRTYLLA